MAVPGSKVPPRLTTQDSSFLYAESQSAPMHIGSLSIFEGNVAVDELARYVEGRLHFIPRYRQRLTFAPLNLAHPCWEDDHHFAVKRHIKQHQLPKGQGESDLIDAAMRIFERPLDRRRPLWEMHLFNGLADDCSAVLWNVHHCLVDGVSGMELLAVMLDFRSDASEAEPVPWQPAPAIGRPASLAQAVFDRAQNYLDFAREAGDLLFTADALNDSVSSLANAVRAVARMALEPPVAAPWNSGLVTQARSLAWLRCPFADVRAIRSTLGGTVNDVVLAILGEGAARYLKHRGCPTGGRPLRIGCPVNVRRRTERGTLGNRVSMMFAELAASPMDPLERHRAVCEETRRVKESGEPQALDSLLMLADLIPPALMGAASAALSPTIDLAAQLLRVLPSGIAKLLAPPAIGINFVATNVPGAQVPQFLAGHRMREYVGLLPLVANLGYGVAILSYNQNLYFGLMAEPHLMPDVEMMKFFVAQVLDELKLAAYQLRSPQIQSRMTVPIEAQPAKRDGGLARSTSVRAPSSGAAGLSARSDATRRH